MPSNTPNLGLLKKDPMLDGNETFNIETMLNENWDKVDEAMGRTGGYGVTTQPKANEYEVNLKPAPASLTAGIRVTVKVNAASTGAPMLNVNGLGSRPVLKMNGSSASFKQDGVYTLVYDGQAFILQGEGGEYGTATAAQVLTPYTLGTENGVVAGTMKDLRGTKLSKIWQESISDVRPLPEDTSQGQITVPLSPYTEGLVNSTTTQEIAVGGLNAGNIKHGVKIGNPLANVPGITGIFTGDGNLDPRYMLTGQVGYDKGVKKSGTMVNRSTNQPAKAKETPVGGNYSLQPPEGYYNGSTWVYTPENHLRPENIRVGKTIGHVTGTMPERWDDMRVIGGGNSDVYTVGPNTTWTENITPLPVVARIGAMGAHTDARGSGSIAIRYQTTSSLLATVGIRVFDGSNYVNLLTTRETNYSAILDRLVIFKAPGWYAFWNGVNTSNRVGGQLSNLDITKDWFLQYFCTTPANMTATVNVMSIGGFAWS